MNIRYTDLYKRMQKVTAVILSSSIILQGCNTEALKFNMKPGTNGNTLSSINIPDQTERSDTTMDFGTGKNPNANKGKKNCMGLLTGIAIGGVAVGVPLAAGLGTALTNANNNSNTCQSQLDGLKTDLNTATTSNAILTGQLGVIQGQNLELSSTNSILLGDLNRISTGSGTTFNLSSMNSTNGARLLEEMDPESRILVGSTNLFSSPSDLAKVTGVNIPGATIYPYTKKGSKILNNTSTAAGDATCINTPLSTSHVVNSITPILIQSDPASIAATAAATVTYGTSETPQAVLTAMQSCGVGSTDPGYVAGLAASQIPGATAISVAAAVINAPNNSPDSTSSIAANAAASISKASSFTVYPYSNMSPSPKAIANAVSSTVGVTAAEITAANTAASVVNTATPASILVNLNSARGNASGTWSDYRFLVPPTTNQDVVTGLVNTYGANSREVAIAVSMNNIGTVSVSNSPYAFNATNLLSAINYASGNPQNTPWSTYISTASTPTSYATANTAVNAFSSSYQTGAIAVINGMNSATPIPTGTTVASTIVNTNPIVIDAVQSSLVPGATCKTVMNDVLESTSRKEAAYEEPTPENTINTGKLLESSTKYFPNLQTVSITGQTITYPSKLNFGTVPKLTKLTLDNCVVDIQIIAPVNISTLSISNSTKCSGGQIISDDPGATIGNPKFRNATVNTAATAFNMQDGNGPLCPNNIGSIRKSGMFPTVEHYARKYATCTNDLNAAETQLSISRSTVSIAISGNINATNKFLDANDKLNACKSMLGTCSAAFKDYVPNAITYGMIINDDCTLN